MSCETVIMEKEFRFIDKYAVAKSNTCTKCDKLLNVPPIFCVDNGLTIDRICGRCVFMIDNKHKKWRQYVYENFAKYVTYPCSNKIIGCDIILNWDEVVDHEGICQFKPSNCPLSLTNLFPEKSCQWVGNVKNLDEHIESAHKGCIINPPQLEWEDTKKNIIFFTNVGTQLVTVVIKYDSDSKYYCLLMINGNEMTSQCFRFQLELFDENKSNSIILRKNRLESSKCILENITNSNKMLEIDLMRIKELLKNPKILFGRFGVVRKNKKEIQQITGLKDIEKVLSPPVTNKAKLQPPDEEILQELECPVCNEHMIPPIYICEIGHSLCSDCKTKVVNCPNCRHHLSEARNFTLEKLTTKVNYPCRNREIGCPFVTTSENIRSHESICELSEYPCILTCGWKGLRPNMYNHLIEKHPRSFLEVNTLYIRDIIDKKETMHVLYVDGELFRFSFKQGEISGLRNFFSKKEGSISGNNKFNMQHVGMVEKEPKFLYKLEIVDELPMHLNMSLTNVCQCVTENPNLAYKTANILPWDMLKYYIFEEKYYYYKINIIKI